MKNVRRIALLLAVAVTWPVLGRGQELTWHQDLNAAKTAAQEKHRPLLLDFGTVNCFWCKQLDATTFRDPSIAKLLAEKFVIVKIDASKNPALAQSMGVSAFPTLIFMTPEGKHLDRHEGYVDASRFQSLLIKAVAQHGNRDAQAPPASKLNLDSTATTRFVLPTPEQLGIGLKLDPPAIPQEAPVDLGSLFIRLRAVGATGFLVERTEAGYRARIALAGPQNQSVSVEGQGPNEGAAISTALARIAK